MPRSVKRNIRAADFNAEYLFAHLMRNMESACIKARRYSLAPNKIVVFLKKNDFGTTGSEAKLSRPCASRLNFGCHS